MIDVTLQEILEHVAKVKRTSIDECFPFCIESSDKRYIAIVAGFGNGNLPIDKKCVFYNSVKSLSHKSGRELKKDEIGFDFLKYTGFNLVDVLNEKEHKFVKDMKDLLS